METGEKRDRLIEVASAVLNAAPNQRLNAVVLNKALFYLDLASLRDRELLSRATRTLDFSRVLSLPNIRSA